MRLHPKTIDKLKATLKKLTGRSNGMGYNQRKDEEDSCNHRRMANLIKCGVPKWRARKHGWIKGYWRAAEMWDCTHAMSNHNLSRAGYRFLMDYYVLVS